jgi:hypothetical protein
VIVSPGMPMGTMCSVLAPLSSERLLVNASRRPSSAQTGCASLCSPAVSWWGGEDPSAAASQTALR